jgi:predicted RecB family nuclease
MQSVPVWTDAAIQRGMIGSGAVFLYKQSMKIPASWFRVLHYPHRCEKRLRFHAQNIPADPLGPFDELLVELGRKHERKHLATFPEFLDLSIGGKRDEQTGEELQQRRAVLYQPLFQATVEIAGTSVTLVGSPDFMLPTPEGWMIRDAKLAQGIDHPEIIAQLNFYGLLYEQLQCRLPVRLEVVLGNGQIMPMPYLGREQVIGQIQELLRAVSNDGAYEPVGWSKCAGCGYRTLCWPRAMERHDVAVLIDVDQGLARSLHENGCLTITDLLQDYNLDMLASIIRPWGASFKKVGPRAATSILNHAQAMMENRVIVLAPPRLPDASNLVMFDLEGLPPQVDDKEKVFLWGLKVFGDRPSPFQYACTFPGQSDEAAWFCFLELAGRIFNDYGEIPFVHWAAYERSKLKLYVERYGDKDGIAVKVRANLLDLLRVMSKSVCLPLPTRSLKEVEKFVGFKRQLPGTGDWAVAQYLRAQETEDRGPLDEILAYNEEDLDATWAVYGWLQSLDSS